MSDVFVYDSKCTNFDNIGQAGSLFPLSCLHTEIKNGMSELELVHPIDQYGKWSFLQKGYILMVWVPVRTTPEIANGEIVTSIEQWKVRSGATKSQRKLYNKSSGGKELCKLPIGTFVRVVKKSGSRYKVKTPTRNGWIASSALDSQVIEPPLADDPAAIETRVPAWTMRPQRFRIYRVEKTDTEVTVLAKHVFYDHTKNLTTYVAFQPGCQETIDGLIGGCVFPCDLEGYTNISGTRLNLNWTREKFGEAIMAPDTGLLAKWGAEIVRDNEEFYVLAEAGLNRGVRIEYGKNLLGVELTLDDSEVVTRYVPVGQTNKGKPLLLVPGTYNTNHGQITIPEGASWVDSPLINDYAIIYSDKLDLGSNAKASSDSDSAKYAARVRMIDACLDKYEKEQVDVPKITLKVDFVQLGDTEEYAQYKRLDDVFLYDRVTIRHPGIQIDVLAEVTEYVWDASRDRVSKMTLGSVSINNVGKPVSSWELPVIPGSMVVPGTIGNGALDDNVPNDLDLTDNPTVQQVAQQYVKNAWITGSQVFKYAAGMTDPDPTSILVTANLQNVLMYRWEYRNSDGVWTPYPTGDGNDTNTATTLVVKPGHAVWVGSRCLLRMLTSDSNVTDTFDLYKVADGATGGTGAPGADGLHGMTAILGNAAHTMPKTTAGVVTYTGSGTTLRVFEGATELVYDGVGTSNGTWKVTTSTVGITRGSLTDSGSYLTVGDHSGMSGGTASVTFNITGKRQNGTDFAMTVMQTLSVALQGVTGANGSNGANAVVLNVYAPNGSVFMNQTGSLIITAVGYVGANPITSGATYVWKKYNAGIWDTIPGQTGTSLTVNGSDVNGLQAYRCEMVYGGSTYSGTVTLTDKTDNYQSSIESTGGDTFRNGVGTSVMHCRLWQNGSEVDALKSAVFSQVAPSSPSVGTFYYKITPGSPQLALMRWNGSLWENVTTNPTYSHTKSYTWYRLDKDGNALDGGTAFATGKAIYINGDNVEVKTTFVCEVA